ncbi:hypothetical protein [Desulfurococcus amylolyticus]|nr:hypothetical protein [Desulfurococcus amylolyticus]
MIVAFRVINRPVFAKTRVGGVQLHSKLSNTPIPLPTTVAGALGALLGVRLKAGSAIDPCSKLMGLEDLNELYSELKEKLKCGDPCIKGPLTYFENWPYLNVGELFVPVAESVLESLRDLHSLPEEKRSEYVRHITLRRVGVALERRDAATPKVVKTGYFYTAPASLYVREAGGTPVQPVFKYVLEGSIDRCGEVVRFGGEGTLAEVYCENGADDVFKYVTSPLEQLDRGTYVALTPIPAIPTPCGQSGGGLGGAFNVEKVAGVCFETPFRLGEIVGLPGSLKDGVVAKPPKIRVERLGLGYSESLNMRRPQILVFPQGTIVQIKDAAPRSFSDLVRVLLEIGFASLLKLPG